MKKIFILFILISLLILSACSEDIMGALEDEIVVAEDNEEIYEVEETNDIIEESPFAFEGAVAATNLIYKTVNGTDLRFDIFFPTEQVFERAPLVVGFHGGGWFAGDRTQVTSAFMPMINELLANGYAFATVQYRLARPGITFPAPFEDARDFIIYVKESAHIYNIDPNNIGLFGYSAGAHLVMLCAYATDLDIRYVVALAGPTKMFGDDPANYPRSTMMMVENFFGGTYDELTDLYRLGSPYYHLNSAEQPPLLLVHDRTDAVVPFSQSEMMFKRAEELGIECELLEISGVGHDIEFMSDRMNEQEEVISIILNFIYKNYKD